MNGPYTVRAFPSLDGNATALDPSGRRVDEFSFCDTAWLSAWDHAFLPGDNWRRPVTGYAVTSSDSHLGFLALADQKLFRFRVKSLAGYYWPFRTLAVRDDDVSRAELADAIGAHFAAHGPGMVLRMGPVSSKDRAVDRLVRALVARGWQALRQKVGDVFELALPADPKALEGQMSKSLLKNLVYRRRRLTTSVGPPSCERHVLVENSTELLDTLAQIESASWVAEPGGEPKFIGDANRTFWSALGQARGRGAEAVMWVMRCGDKPVAFSAHIETADTIHIIANSYREEWKVYSPGHILTLEVLTDACRRGKVRVNWGQGDSGYKTSWGATSGETLLLDFLLFRPGPLGWVLASALRRLRPAWKRLDDA